MELTWEEEPRSVKLTQSIAIDNLAKRARTSTNNTYEESTTDYTEEEIYTLGGQK